MAPSSMFSLSGKTAWVVGATGLLGDPSARALAEHGAHVVISARNAERCEALVEALRSAGHSAEAVPLNVTNHDAVGQAARSIARAHGGIDVCANFSFGASGKTLDEITVDEWEAGVAASGSSAFFLSREVAAHMGAGSSIIHLSSMYGMVSPDPANYPASTTINPPDYGFAKAGLLQLVRYLAVQWGSRGIRVNAITPGPFPGEAAKSIDDFAERLARRVPLQRTGEPHEVAGGVVFLASDASSFVTGSNLVIDGGWTSW